METSECTMISTQLFMFLRFHAFHRLSMSLRSRGLYTYGRRPQRMITVIYDDLWLSEKEKHNSVFSCSSHSNDSLSTPEKSTTRPSQPNNVHLGKRRKQNKENVPCSPEYHCASRNLRSGKKTGFRESGSNSSTGSEGIFEAVERKHQRFSKKNSLVKPAATKGKHVRKITNAGNPRFTLSPTSSENSSLRESTENHVPEHKQYRKKKSDELVALYNANFSDIDKFDLCVSDSPPVEFANRSGQPAVGSTTSSTPARPATKTSTLKIKRSGSVNTSTPDVQSKSKVTSTPGNSSCSFLSSRPSSRQRQISDVCGDITEHDLSVIQTLDSPCTLNCNTEDKSHQNISECVATLSKLCLSSIAGSPAASEVSFADNGGKLREDSCYVVLEKLPSIYVHSPAPESSTILYHHQDSQSQNTWESSYKSFDPSQSLFYDVQSAIYEDHVNTSRRTLKSAVSVSSQGSESVSDDSSQEDIEEEEEVAADDLSDILEVSEERSEVTDASEDQQADELDEDGSLFYDDSSSNEEKGEEASDRSADDNSDIDDVEESEQDIETEEGSDVTRYMIAEDVTSCTPPRENQDATSGFCSSGDEEQEFKSPPRLRSQLESFVEILTPVKSRKSGRVLSAREKVLDQCGQSETCTFTDCIPPGMLKTCVKIGEGVYGEVFRAKRSRTQSVALKIIPIEGDLLINDENQKTYEEILPEIVISKELSALRDYEDNGSENFVLVNRVLCVQGQYPDQLLDEWDTYHRRKVSENDRPDIFPENQLFIIFEFADAGSDLENFKFENMLQARSVLQQVSWSLAVAEQALQFEHRDLHWGNVLVKPTKQKTITYYLNEEVYEIDTFGVFVTIIDFTLSRVCKEGCTVFTDLSADEMLFKGEGDYQFDIYRKMSEHNGGEWKHFEPYTNVLWIHYIADKLLHGKSYSKTTRQQKYGSKDFRSYLKEGLDYNAALDLVLNNELIRCSEES